TLLLILILILFSPLFAVSQEIPTADGGEVCLLVIDKLALDDLSNDNTPALVNLVKTGSVGLSSNRTLGRGNTEDACLTIGAGNLAQSFGQRIMGLNSDELVETRNQTASQLHQNLTGKNPANTSVLMIKISELLAGVAKNNVNTQLGTLGEILGKSHIPVCVLGNGDINQQFYRASVAIAMDASGRVPLGNVGPLTSNHVKDSFVTTQTNYTYLEKESLSYTQKPLVKIIELSDLARLEKADTADPEILKQEKRNILKKIDGFANSAANNLDFNRDLLMVVVPSAAADKVKQKDTFTPIIIKGPGYKEGFLSSGATRSDYIIASTDIASTILHFYKLQDDTGTMIGQPIVSRKSQQSDTLSAAKLIEDQAKIVNLIRTPLVKGYVILQIAVIVLILLCLVSAKKMAELISPLLLVLLAAPLVFLLLGKLGLVVVWHNIIVAIGSILLITLIFSKIYKNNLYTALVVIAAATLIIINYDVLTGSSLIKSSVLGYDLMSGARYYGIGNEYVGVVVGSSILLASSLYQRFNKPLVLWLIALFFLSQCILLGSPGLGAQSDGMITTPIAFLLTLALITGKKINLKALLILGVTVAVTVIGGVVYDMSSSLEMQSHIGRAANQITQGGIHNGLTIIMRKLAMNIKLINYSIWSYVFLVILATLGILLYVPVGGMTFIKSQYPILFKGFAGILAGAIVGGVINDSGIVLAATTSIYLVAPILSLMINIPSRVSSSTTDSSTLSQTNDKLSIQLD
ncbi:MAG: hypothetical protein PHC92_08760, partial [Syntrophomonadaceae bacterium]|nr:hypothetical protein [Syntrophomonadaceae bacterium]